MAAGGSLLSLVLVFLFIPGDIKAETKKTHGSKKEASALLNVGEIAKLLFLPGTAIILLVKLACGVPIGVLQSMFSGESLAHEHAHVTSTNQSLSLSAVIAMERFGLPSEQNGFMLSYIGCISLVMQGVGIVVCSKFFTDKSAMNGSVVVLTITYYLMVRERTLRSPTISEAPFLLSVDAPDRFGRVPGPPAAPDVRTLPGRLHSYSCRHQERPL